MKVIIQIPCYNEEGTIAATLSELPRKLEGVDTVEWLIVDDGCTDKTVEKALENGADHVVTLTRNQGLARAFMAGLKRCLELDADIIVNTDGDNQYSAADIETLIRPILTGTADMVIGQRPINDIEHFSFFKKFLQKAGSYLVSYISGVDIPDVTSGFRSISKNAALRINVFSNYSYTLETVIQARRKGIALASVPVHVNGKLRPSRLMKSTSSYLYYSIVPIVRIFTLYKPFRFFMGFSLLSILAGLALGIRYLYFMLIGNGSGHVQSVILSGTLLITGVIIGLLAFIADLLSVNRRLLEEIQTRLRSKDYN